MTDRRDDFDRVLTERLGATEHRVPGASPPPAKVPERDTLRWVVAATAAVAVVLAVLLIGQLPDRSVGDATPSPRGSEALPSADQGVVGEASNEDFLLQISSPRSTWQEGDLIDVVATLRYVGSGNAITVVSICGPIVFDLEQLEGGDGDMWPAICAACVTHRIEKDDPVTREFETVGNVTGSLADYYGDDRRLRLPPGRWSISAGFGYTADGTCGETGNSLRAQIELAVVEAEDSPGPSPVATEPPRGSQGDDPTAITFVTGVLEGDPQLEGGCVWLRDQTGSTWEIIWPTRYEASFREGAPVLIADGEVVAIAGDRITAYGRRPSGVGSRCMMGTVWEADSILFR